VPLISLTSGDFIPVEGAVLFPWIAANLLYYLVLADGSVDYAWRHWQYWVGHAPIYIHSFWIALQSRKRKPGYKVTRKTRVSGFYGRMLWPQFGAIAAGLIGSGIGIVRFGAAHPLAVVTNIGIILYYLLMLSGICRAAFYGVGPGNFPFLGALLGLGRRRGRVQQKETVVASERLV
jgi:hypothetical protein